MEVVWIIAAIAAAGCAFISWKRRATKATADYVMPFEKKQTSWAPSLPGMPKVFSKKEPTTMAEAQSSIVVINLFAETEAGYGSYDLLQALSNAGLHYGSMKIFHRYETVDGEGKKLFNLASINKPGTFDLNAMGSFSCPGLSIFADMNAVQNPLYVFDLMVETACQLIDDLGGSMYEDTSTLLTDVAIERIRDRLYNMYNMAATTS